MVPDVGRAFPVAAVERNRFLIRPWAIERIPASLVEALDSRSALRAADRADRAGNKGACLLSSCFAASSRLRPPPLSSATVSASTAHAGQSAPDLLPSGTGSLRCPGAPAG